MAIKGNQIGSVYIKVRPDAKDFRRDTQRQVGRRPIEVEVDVELNEASAAELRRDVDRASRDASKRGRIRFTPDLDGVKAGLRDVDRMLADLRAESIEVGLDEDSLKSLRADMVDVLGEGVETSITYNEDEAGYRSVLERIAELRREKAEVEVVFDTDDESLDRVEREMLDALEAIGATPISVELDEAGLRRAITDLDASVDLSDASVEQLRAKYEALKNELEDDPVDLTFRYNEDLDGYHSLLARIDEIRRERASIPVDLDVDDDELAQLRRAVADNIVRLSPALDKSAAVTAEAQLGVLARDRFVDIKARVNTRALATVSGAFMSLAGLNTVGDFVRMLENVALSFDTIMMQVGTTAGAIGALVSVGTVGLGAILTTVRDIGQAFQLIAFAPTALLSAFTGFQAWSSIWGNFEGALMGIPLALAKLPPNALRAVDAINALSDVTKDAVQDNFWGQMNDEVYRFAENIGPTVVEAMGNVATQLGRAVSEMLNHTERLVQSGQLQEFADNNTRLYKDLADAVIPFFEAFMTLGVRGSKYLPTMGRALEDMSLHFRDFIAHADETGKIDHWIRTGVRAFQDLGSSVVDTLKILGNFADIFERLNVGGLEEMAAGLERIERFTASTGFQQRMENIFSGAKDGAAAAAQGFGDLMQELYRSDQLVSDLLAKSGRLAGTFMTALAEAGSSDVFQKGLLDSLDGLQDFVRRAQPAFNDIADIFGRLGTIGAEVAREIAPGLNITMGLIDGFLEAIGPSMERAVEPLTRIFEDLAALSTGPILLLTEGVAAVLDLFTRLDPVLQNVILSFGILARTGVGAAMTTAMAKLSTQFTAVERAAAISATGVAGHMTRMQTSALVATRAIGGAFKTMWAAVGGAPGLIIGGIIGAVSAIVGANARAEQSIESLVDAMKQGPEAMREWNFDTFRTELGDFAAAGGDVAAVLDELGKGRDAVDVANELALAYEAVGAAAAGMSPEQMEMIGLDAESFERGIALAEKYGVANEEAGSKASALGSAIRGKAGEIDAATSAFGLEEEALGGVNAEMERMAEATPRFQEIADAIARVRDETASTEDRVRALRDTMELLAGGGPSTADEFEKESYRTMQRVIETLEGQFKQNEGRFKLSDLFDKDGTTNLSTEIGQEIDDQFRNALVAADNGMMAIRTAYENGDIGIDEYNRRISEEFQKLVKSGEEMGKALGYTGEELDAFKARWAQFLDESGSTEANYKVAFDGAADVEAELENLKAMGLEFSEAEYEAIFDADDDGVVTKVEQAERLAIMFSEGDYEASLSTDSEEAQAQIIAAAEAGAVFDGTDWVATLNADGTMNQEAIDAAIAYGIMFDGKEWTSILDANGEPSQAAIETARAAGLKWDGETWKSTIDANNEPSKAQIAEARKLGMEWRNGDYRAIIPANADPARREIADAMQKGREYGRQNFSATVSVIDNATTRIRGIVSALDKIKDRTATITTYHKQGLNAPVADGAINAPGSRFPLAWNKFADGGFAGLSPKPTLAHIASAGSYVTYAETETGGEAFIPLSPAKRERSIAIWQETGRRLGMADGGVVGGTVSEPSITNNISVPNPGATGDDIAQAIGFYTRRNGRR